MRDHIIAIGKIKFGQVYELELRLITLGNEGVLMETLNRFVNDLIEANPQWGYKIETSILCPTEKNNS